MTDEQLLPNKKKPLKITINIKNTQYPVIKQSALEFGLKTTKDNQDSGINYLQVDKAGRNLFWDFGILGRWEI